MQQDLGRGTSPCSVPYGAELYPFMQFGLNASACTNTCLRPTDQRTGQPASRRNRKGLWPFSWAGQSHSHSSRLDLGHDAPTLPWVWCENQRHRLQARSLSHFTLSFSYHRCSLFSRQVFQHQSRSQPAELTPARVRTAAVSIAQSGRVSSILLVPPLPGRTPVRVLVCRQGLVSQNYFSSLGFSPE